MLLTRRPSRDYSSSLTIENKGVREVPVKTTGHNKLHVTVMLTARPDGFKCRPYILLKNKRPIKEIVTKFKNTLHLCWAGCSFFNDNLTSDFFAEDCRLFYVWQGTHRRLFYVWQKTHHLPGTHTYVTSAMPQRSN